MESAGVQPGVGGGVNGVGDFFLGKQLLIKTQPRKIKQRKCWKYCCSCMCEIAMYVVQWVRYN